MRKRLPSAGIRLEAPAGRIGFDNNNKEYRPATDSEESDESSEESDESIDQPIYVRVPSSKLADIIHVQSA